MTAARTSLLRGTCADVAVLGGKAAAIDRLLALGAPVPPAAVVTTAAYREFVIAGGLQPLLEELRRDPLPSVGARELARREVEEAFLAAPVPASLAAEIEAVARCVGDGAKLAVRSSATAEDQRSASFAGQYVTFLDVAPADVVTAVRRCWASLWYPTPRTYRRFLGIDESDLAMAVLLMPMMAPSHAGVLFSVAPERPAAMRIEVVEGLGEGLVSGARTPDVLLLERSAVATGNVAPGNVATGNVTATVAAEPGGSLPPSVQQALHRLAAQALAWEVAFEAPLDVEWAIEDGALRVLQARPITTGGHTPGLDDGFDTHLDPGTRYTTAGIAEMLPGPLPPRLWAVNSWGVEEAFRRLFAELGAELAPLRAPHALIARAHGRAVMDLDLLERTVASVPGGSAAELEHEYFGRTTAAAPAPRPAPSAGLLVQGVRSLRARGLAYRRAELLGQAIDQVLDREPDLCARRDGELLALRRRVCELGARAMGGEVAVAAAASASSRGLERFLHAHLPAAEADAAMLALTTVDPAGGAAGTPALRRLAERLRDDPRLCAARRSVTYADAAAALHTSDAGRAYLADLDLALRRAGSRSVFGGPTWQEAPERMWPVLQTLATAADPGDDPDAGGSRFDDALQAVARRIAADRRWRATRAQGGHLLDVRVRFLRREATDAVVYLERRERMKRSVLQLGGVLRRIDVQLGQRLAARGRLEDAADVDLLGPGELADLFGPRPLGLDVIAARRRVAAAAALEPAPPEVFLGRPEVGAAIEQHGDRFTGWPAGAGRFEGPARVVRDPDSSGLRRGEVLVARTTDSSWLPLFHLAGAVIVEEGGPLSHAAILARELGVPAVLNVAGIVDRLAAADGATVTVDGTRGEIVVHPAPAPDPAPAPAPVLGDGLAPVRTPGPIAADVPPRMSVFITGLLATGAVVSLVAGLTQAVGSVRTRQRIEARARPKADALAVAVLFGFRPVTTGAAGLRSHRYHTALAVLAAAAAALVLLPAAGAVHGGSASSPLAWWFGALAAAGAVPLAALAAAHGTTARRWPQAVALARFTTTAPARRSGTPATLIGPRHAAVAGAMLAAVGVQALLLRFAEGAVRRADGWVLDAIDAGASRRPWAPAPLTSLISKEVIVALAIAAIVVGLRCRTARLALPLAIAASGAAHLGLAHLVPSARPDVGPKPGYTDSFPGGHVNELLLVGGLVLVATMLLSGRRPIVRAATVLCAAVLAPLVVDAVRLADHWPSDNLAGALIAGALVITAHGAIANPDRHDRCRAHPPMRPEVVHHDRPH